MMDATLSDILKLSLELETTAMRFYQQLSDGSRTLAEKTFWRQLAQDEGSHLQYWQKLLELAETKKINNLFDYPVRIYNELIRVRSICGALLEDEALLSDMGKSLMTAVRLEFHMLHPAFGAMFHLYEKQVPGGPWPEADYHRHLRFLMEGFHQFAADRPEYVLIADMLQTIWQSNQQLARQLGEVRTLRGLLPICMHCKKIRNEDGFWVSVEGYISAHSDADFSHGICEECIQKYYPDYADLINHKEE